MIKPEEHLPELQKVRKQAIPIPNYPARDELAEARATAEQLAARGIDITQGYDNWLQAGFALAYYGESGRELFHTISNRNAGYDYQECDKQFTACLKNYNQSKTTKATFFQMCKDAGVDVSVGSLLGTTAPTQQSMAQPGPEVQPTPEDLLKELQQYRFNAGRPVPKPNPIISIEGNIIATPANIITLVGQAKSGKSGIVAGILSGVMCKPGDIVDTLGFTVKHNQESKAVIHIDGEQSSYNHYAGMMKVLERTDRDEEPEWFHSYNFKSIDITKRIKVLDALFDVLAKQHNGIHLAVIDGGADFVLDTNDLKESNAVVHFFESLATRYECAIVMILHFNPGSEKGRGHFGSQLERKSESVISVSKEEESEISTIKGKLLRNSGCIPQLQFIYDVDKGHHVYYGTLSRTSKAEAKHMKLQQLAEKVFEGGKKQLSYTDLYTLIMDEDQVKERAAKNRVKELLDAEIVTKTDESEPWYSLNAKSGNTVK